jgi:flagellar protein FlbB
MANISNKSKIIYMIALIIFVAVFGLFWLDHIGLISLQPYVTKYRTLPPLGVDANDDEPTLIEREEFRKEQQRLLERIQDLDKREMTITEEEKRLVVELEKIEEMKRGIDLEKKKLESEKAQYSGYKENVLQLASKLYNMAPEESVGIMAGFEDALLIDVLRQMDVDAAKRGVSSITPYLMTLMPKDKASRIMYLMTQL